MIEASIDVGTNTMLLLIAEIEEYVESPASVESKEQGAQLKEPVYNNQLNRSIKRVLEDRVQYARLGQGIRQSKAFHPEAMARAEKIFKEYKSLCDECGVQKITCVGTSASRNATNASEFYQRIFEQTGIQAKIISGETEASISFLGGLLPNQDPLRTAIMDIGGGSTEFVTQKTVEVSPLGQSIEIGCVMATEGFLKGDPYEKEGLAKLENHLRETWKKLTPELQEELRIKEWTGVAGTATTLAALDLKLSSFISTKVDNYRLSRCEVGDWYESLAIMSQSQRERMSVIGPGRADIMVAGVLILLTAMEVFDKQDIVVSSRGLRQGVLLYPELLT